MNISLVNLFSGVVVYCALITFPALYFKASKKYIRNFVSGSRFQRQRTCDLLM